VLDHVPKLPRDPEDWNWGSFMAGVGAALVFAVVLAVMVERWE